MISAQQLATTDPDLDPGPGPDRLATGDVFAQFQSGLRAWFVRRTGDTALADDLVGDVFLKLVQRREQLDDDRRVAGWIWTVARRTLVDHCRRAQSTTEFHEDTTQIAAGHAGDGGNSGTWGAEEPLADELAALATWLRWEIQALAPAYRDTLELTEIEGLSQREAAEKLGISVSGVKSRVQRGRAMLKQRLLRCCDVEFDHRGVPVDFRAKRGGCDDCGSPS